MPESTITLAQLSENLAERATSNREVIIDRLFLDRLELMPFCQEVPTVIDEQPILNPNVSGSLTQRGRTGEFNPNGTFSFVDETLKVRAFKADLLFKEDQIAGLEQTYLGMTTAAKRGGNALYDPSNFSFSDYIIEKLAMPKILQEANQAMILGDYESTDVAVPAHLKTMDGFLTLVRKAIAAGKISGTNLIAGAAFTSSNAASELKKFENAYVAMAGELFGKRMPVFCSPSVHMLYRDRYRIDNSGQQGINKDGVQLVNMREELPIYPIAGMGASNRVVALAEGNLFMSFDRSRFKLEPHYDVRTRSLAFVCDWAMGLQIGSPQQIFANNYTGIS